MASLYANNNYDEIEETINNLVKKLFYFITIPFILFIISSKMYIPIIFGENWVELYKYFYVLSLLVYVSLMMVPISSVLKIYSLQNISFKQHFLVISVKVIALTISLFLSLNFLLTLFMITIFHIYALYFNVRQTFAVIKIKMPFIYNIIFLIVSLFAIGIYYVI